jgi:hypothetical protein
MVIDLYKGTLITFMRRPIPEVLNPIYERLEDEQSLLRRSGDVGMLAQALLDVCKLVDDEARHR